MSKEKVTLRRCCFPGCDQERRKSTRFFCGRAHFDEARKLLTEVHGEYRPGLTPSQMRSLLKSAKQRYDELETLEGVSVESELRRALEREKGRADWAEKVYKSAKKKIMTQAELVEKITSGIASLDPPRPRALKISRRQDHSPQIAVALMSDLHMGESGKEEETHAPGYDYQVFLGELSTLEKKIAQIISHHRNIHPIKKLVLLWLGDFVDGHEVFPGQAWRTEDNAVVQVLSGTLRLADFVNTLSSIFPEIEVVCVPGNHGDVRGKEPGTTNLNWDFLTYHNIRNYLRNNERIKFEITPSWWTIKKIGKFNFYLDHGTTFGRRWMGIPFYGIERAEARTRKMLYAMRKLRKSSLHTFNKQNPVMREMIEECAPHILTEDLQFDYITLGHHHVPWLCEGKILNGAFSRGNYYAMKALQSLSIPTQWLFSVHPDIGATWFYPLRLDMGG